MTKVEVHKSQGVAITFPMPATIESRGGRVQWTWESGSGVHRLSGDGGKTWVNMFDCEFAMMNAKSVGSYEE